MERMDRQRVEEALAGPHQAVLSIGRADRGPLAVPISYRFDAGEFSMITSPTSLHGQLIERTGRATMTVHHDTVSGRTVHQWYVIAEGPIAFTDADPAPLLRAILEKDRPGPFVDEWEARMGRSDDTVAVLRPERLSGYESRSLLD
jgi:nitroimidazol reductase NimA-like FMN-containing flavoprotein (pyridoxamine 5'-phosphate oxidase superfamily)